MVIVMMVALVPSTSAAERRVLIDLSHGEKIYQSISRKEYNPCFDLFKDVYEITENRDSITYKKLQDHDLLIVGMPASSFSTTEVDVVVQFVYNGGGLLLIGEPEKDARSSKSQHINSLSSIFGIEFNDTMHLGNFKTTEAWAQNHPIFQNVLEIYWAAAGIMTVKEPSRALYYREGKCMIAYCEYGGGRIIFLSDSDFFLSPLIDMCNNRQFVTNIFHWLSEPGGPYLQKEEYLNIGLKLIDEGNRILQAGDFAFAESVFTEAKRFLEGALSIYESSTIENLITEVLSLKGIAEIGVTAESLLQEGKDLYRLSQFALAIVKLEEAQELFKSIDSSKSEECASLIEEYTINMENGGNLEEAEALMNEGITCHREQEYDLAKIKFEEAFAIFTELQNTEKMQECERWIASCEASEKDLQERESRGVKNGMIISIVVLISASVLVAGVLVLKRKKKDYHKLEREKMNLDQMLAKGLISQKEYEIAKKDIEKQSPEFEEHVNRKGSGR